MIIDELTNMEFYQGLEDQLYKGLAFLEETDAVPLPVGRYEIEGEEMSALVQEYETCLPEEYRREATTPTPISNMSWKEAKRWAGNRWMAS